MKVKFGILVVFSVALFLIMATVHAQVPGQNQASPVQQSATMLNSATKVADCNVAVNTTACTATLTPSGANYVYVTAIDMAVCQDATGIAQTNVTWTTTGLTGTPIPWTYSTALAVNACLYKVVTYYPAVKSSTAGTAVTVVSPAATLHTGYNANVVWYEAQ